MFFDSVRRLAALFSFAAICFSSSVFSEPWVTAGDERTRHHIQVLADAGVIYVPVSAWPLMWSGLEREILAIDPSQLSQAQMNSYRYLRSELRKAESPLHAGQALYLRSAQQGLMDFSNDSRELLESRSFVAYQNGSLAFKLQGSLVGRAIDGQRSRADGSYVAGTLGNWSVGVGAIDRWWGPSWQSSLILSSAARPAPGVFLNRVDTRAFDLPALELLGPWDLRVFLNQKEGNRPSARAKLIGMRMSFKPFRQFEIGFSRTAQWGGKGRLEDARSFRMMLLGKSNRGDHGILEDGSNEPANQLAGYDWRLSHSLRGGTGAFYGQLIGEDEAGYLPYKWIGLAGVELSNYWRDIHNRIIFEVSNTTMEFDKGGTPNFAYEHPGYPAGYRYRGRPLGASIDNDSELIVLKGLHHMSGGRSIGWTLGRARVNTDGTQIYLSAGGNVLSDYAVSLWYGSTQYTLPITDSSSISIGGQYYSKDLEIRDQSIASSVSVSYQWVLHR